jgi:steroid delta-isomerase-like uncharacterized protein
MASTQQLVDYQHVWVEGLNRGDVSVADEAFAPDVVIHFIGLAEPVRGVEAWKQLVADFLTAFPDMRFTMDDCIAAGDRVAWRWHARGTHTGPLGALPATGRAVAIDGLIFDRVVDGRVVERWEQLDQPGMLRQLGVQS